MILLFGKTDQKVFVVDTPQMYNQEMIQRLEWLFSGAPFIKEQRVEGRFIGPRKEMITPWSTNAVEISQNMGFADIRRIEEFLVDDGETTFDPMLERKYAHIGQEVFDVNGAPEPILYTIDDIAKYNATKGLAMTPDEMEYLDEVAEKMGRSLTDSEIFGFSQVNSEHCRHKIFNGEFVVDGDVMPHSLFNMIKSTTRTNPNRVVSAYKDNCAFIDGPVAMQFAPEEHDKPDFFATREFDSVISIKAETHNFPTTVEPFNGAATGTGGEIRDRIAGGKGAFPMAGTAVYMTSYPRTNGMREWEKGMQEREWLYQTPLQILNKASNGASDFGNKFGQALICGSVLTFEHQENGVKYGYDKVVMQAGGVGYGNKLSSMKDVPKVGDKVVLLGGDNYRIGMGGGAVSSVDTGEFDSNIELNAVQRSNPEMQKRVYNTIRALSEEKFNPIVSLHDHGAGGHLNCLSELVEDTGGRIDIEKLPIGDPTLSVREIVGNESQERMGLVIAPEYIDKLQRIADRERAPMYVVGETTGDMKFTFVNNITKERPIDWKLEYMFGKVPHTVMNDKTVSHKYKNAEYKAGNIVKYIEQVLQLEAVACKDWLTNKVDRSVTARIAMQQTTGQVQLPLNDCGVVAMDYLGTTGVATSLGHAPVAALADAGKGSVLAIAESLTNIVFAPLTHGIRGVSLSANWMWPCKNEGEDVRLYSAVEAASEFAIALGINIPTGKDSLSMTQKYPDGDSVLSPGTVVITAVGEVSDVRKCVSVALKQTLSQMVYVDLSGGEFGLGGSSFGQVVGSVGMDVPTVESADYFARGFGAVQKLINDGKVMSGHDVSAGGLVTALLEMTFTDNRSGMNISLDALGESDIIKVLFSERPSLVLQVADAAQVCAELSAAGVKAYAIGDVTQDRKFNISNHGVEFELLLNDMRDVWFESSYLLDRLQSGEQNALARYNNYKKQELNYRFPANFSGKLAHYGLDPKRAARSGLKAAVIREKGVNGEREMAWALHLAGFDVKDVHMTDLVHGRETLEDVNIIVFAGGFSNSDVLGSAKGWAGSFLYNDRAKLALDRFMARPDTLSLGVCNGCQLMMEMGMITPTHKEKPHMAINASDKFESSFIGVNVLPTSSVMLRTLEGSSLGAWISHGEGRFDMPYEESRYNVALKYAYADYPANPNGSDYSVAGIVSDDGRHLAMMPHVERSLRSWSWAYYPEDRAADEVSPWVEVFVNAAKWCRESRDDKK